MEISTLLKPVVNNLNDTLSSGFGLKSMAVLIAIFIMNWELDKEDGSMIESSIWVKKLQN